jgi:hypothetical protein
MDEQALTGCSPPDEDLTASTAESLACFNFDVWWEAAAFV